jgi:hypothetical protein
MSQFLRPNENITQTDYTGGFADIDEETASDADFAFGLVNSTTATLEVGTSNPAATPGGVTGTVRWRSARRNQNGAIGSGNTFTGTCALRQGATQIAADAYTPGDWATREFTFTLASVSNFNDLRLRFTQTASGGANNNQRSGLAVSWAEIELPGARRVIIIQ